MNVMNLLTSSIPAADYTPPPPDYGRFIWSLIALLLIIIGSWSLVEFILGIFHWITSGQNLEKKKEAKRRTIKGMLIFLILLGIWLGILFVQSFFKESLPPQYIIPMY